MRDDEAPRRTDVDDLQVAPLTVDDLDEIARLHVLAFPDSELGRQGLEAVRRSYLWQFEGPHDLTTVGVRLDGRLVGFLFGGVFRGSTIGFLKREWRFLLWQVVRHPSTMVRRVGMERVVLAVRLLLRRSPAASAEAPVPEAPRSFGVLAIGVDPGCQGRGVGQAAMAAAESAAIEQGFEQMHLTVHPENERAVRFYEAGGWERATDGTGPWTGKMSRSITD